VSANIGLRLERSPHATTMRRRLVSNGKSGKRGFTMHRGRGIVFVCLLLCSLPAAAGLSFVQAGPTPFSLARDGSGLIGLATADLNGDGKPDLVVTYYDNLGSGNQGFVAVMLGNGDGTFKPPTVIYTLPLNVGAYGVLAKDFDRDGKIDLVVASAEAKQILWFKGHGDGTFDAPLVTNTNHHPQGLQSADLNGDGILDLVTLNPGDNSVSVLIGAGNGTFAAPTDYAAGSNPLDLAIGDVNGDGRPDIVVANYSGAAVGVLLNNGGGTFGGMTNNIANMGPQGLYLADFDGDGKLDVVAGGNNCNSGLAIDGSGCLVFMKGNGSGGFATPTGVNFTAVDDIPIRRYSENIAPDLNGDSKADVVFIPLMTGGFGKAQVMIGLGRGDGTFDISYWAAGPAQQTTLANPDFVNGVATIVADFDRDGLPDLAFATQGKDNTRGGVTILFGDTPGTFETARSYSTLAHNFGNDGGTVVGGGAFGKFTASGHVDFAVLAEGGCPGDNPLIGVFRGNGDGSFGAPIAGAPLPSCEGSNSFLRAADLAKSGTDDVVFFYNNSNSNCNTQVGVVGSGNGNGTFNLSSSFGLGTGGCHGALNLVFGDFNGDGFPDVAAYVVDTSVGCPQTRWVQVFLQGAGGTRMFTSKSLLAVTSQGGCQNSPGLVTADFDNDGRLDIVAQVALPGSNNAVFFKGNGDGTFQDPTTIGTGLPSIEEYVAADLRKNGKLDLVGVGGGGVWVQLGNGNGTFQSPVAYGIGGNCSDTRCGVRVADFDGDGKPDIAVVINDSFGGLAVLLGNGDGTFQPAVKFSVGATGTTWLDVADVNGDGLPDILVGHSNNNGNVATVLVNNSLIIADLAITKTDSPDPVSVGRNLTYTITVTNNGPYPATGVTTTDSLPNGVTFVSANATQGSCGGTATVTCNMGSLAKGASATVTIVVIPSAAGGISNTATVTANEFDPDLSNNSATQGTTVTLADVSLTKTDSPDPVTVGSNLTYTITVRNGGPSTATGVTMTDALPAGVTFVSATPSQGNCNGTATVTCNLGSLSNGGSAIVTIVVKPTAAGTITNTASVSAAETDPDLANNSSSQDTMVNAPARQLTSLGAAKLWLGQNGSVRKLKYDALVEVLVNGTVIGSGQLLGVKAGGATFGKAVLGNVALQIPAPVPAPTGATLGLRVSVRISCAATTPSVSTKARFWYDGKAIDSGTGRDAGSRFGATIGGGNSNYFARTALALATAAGNSKQLIDVAVNNQSACPGRPFTPFGTWSMVLP
jgi:uncharacterized repeat protein (TIGR01451 family)